MGDLNLYPLLPEVAGFTSALDRFGLRQHVSELVDRADTLLRRLARCDGHKRRMPGN